MMSGNEARRAGTSKNEGAASSALMIDPIPGMRPGLFTAGSSGLAKDADRSGDKDQYLFW